MIDTPPAARPERITLEGRHVNIVPLDPATPCAGSHGAERDDFWRYLFARPFADESAFRTSSGQKFTRGDCL